MARGETYEEFVEKFRPKKTTDDCYTPPEVYEAVADYVSRRFGVRREDMVRPFYPGGDYERFDYPDGCAVVDNPPFSILAGIMEFYLDRGIPFFLFAPALTALSGAKTVMRVNHIITDCQVTYHNGAKVRTSFVTNLGDDGCVIESCPELAEAVNAANERNLGKRASKKTRWGYPANVATVARFLRMSKYGIEARITREHCVRVAKLDMQEGSGIFGGGLLVSDEAAEMLDAAHREIIRRGGGGLPEGQIRRPVGEGARHRPLAGEAMTDDAA